MRDRLCVTCRHFTFYPAEQDWSATTPGEEAFFLCARNHWVFDPRDDTLEDFRLKMAKAQTCPDFEFSEELKR